jgi:hypothetical protein
VRSFSSSVSFICSYALTTPPPAKSSPTRCGWFALSGGWYALLASGEKITSVVLETTPGRVETERSFAVP